MAKRVAIIGLAFRFPGTSTEQYWPDLLEGKDLITQVDPSRWSADAYVHPGKDHPGTAYTHAAGSLGDISGFDADFFGISPREAALMDPQQRLLLEMSWEAMEDAGIKPSALRGSDCGVYIGISSVDYGYRLTEDLGAIESSTATGNTSSIAANRLSYFFDLRGPSISLDTACSSSLVAFHQACSAILAGECSHAITGGISLHLHPYGFVIFSKASMLSRRGRCSVFDAAADGYVRSEGGGIFVLKDYDQAVADGDRILAVVAGSAVNTDGRKSSLTVPSADAQAELMRRVYAHAGITPAELDYLEAHGTGTSVGDPIETRAIGAALGKRRSRAQPLPIGSVKSNMGHLEPASGVAGMVKAIYALNHRMVPATIGVRDLNPNIAFQDWNIEVVTQNRPLKSQGRLVVGVNSFGFGGANAHVILESAPAAAEMPASKLLKNAPVPIVVTGKSQQALRDAAAALAARLRNEPGRPLYDFAYHTVHRRDWHPERALVFAGDKARTAADLQALADGALTKYRVATGTAVKNARGPVFVYSGNGSQWAGMGRRLMADVVFAAAVHEVDALFSEYSDFSPTAELTAGDSDRYDLTEIAQPALFALQVGITRMLAQRGVAPAATMGHSVGEVAAAWACGALSLPEAVKVIYHRSRLQGLTKGKGRMTAVGISGAETEALIAELGLGHGLEMAGANSHRGATVAGDPALLDKLEAVLGERSIFHRRLNLDYAFHSPAMDPIQNGIVQSLADLTPRNADIPFYSTVSGRPEAGRELDAAYWWRNVRLPVQFESACAAAIGHDMSVFVEIGPHAVLRSYLNDALHRADRPGRVLITASRGDDDPEQIHDVAGQVILTGADIDWQALFPWKGEHTTLPTYPWQRERHWHAVTAESPSMLARARGHFLLGYAQRQHEGLWENQLDVRQYPMLADHVVGDAIVFPGTGYAELALAAAQQSQPGEYADIEELEIHAPLVLGNTASTRVRFNLDGKDGRFQILGREQGSENPWTLHASGRIRQEANAVPLRGGAALSLPTCAPDFIEADHNQLTRAVGLDYGPAFRAISHGWRESADSVLAVFEPHAGLAAELAASHLHPALLDCSFQLIIQLLKDDPAVGQGIAFVPAKIGRLSMHAGQGQPKYARARLRQRGPHSLTADFDLFDADGKLIAGVRGARFRSIRLRSAAGAHLDFVDCVLTPRPHPQAPAQESPLSGESLSRALHRLAQDLQEEGSDRFSQEVDPLLESLCDCQAVEALRAQASGGTTLSASVIERRLRRAPEAAAIFEHTIARAVAAGIALPSPTGWTLAADEEGQPVAADIWNSLLREYPDYVPAIYAAGRVGLHLPQLLQGAIRIGQVVPQAVTPTAISRLVLGAERGQRLAAVLAQTLRRAAGQRKPGQRLALLEIAQGAPLVGPACCASLDFGVADYRYASTDSQAVEDTRHALLDSYPLASAVLIGDAAAAPDNERYDLVVLHCEFDSRDACHAALSYGLARLKPDGKLLLRGTHPSAWADFIFGTRGASQPGDTDNTLSAMTPASHWQAWLQERGLACEPIIEFAPGSQSGPYLLLAGAPQASIASPACESRSQLLLSSESGADAALAELIDRHLRDAGQHSVVAAGNMPAHMEAAIREARARHGQLHDIVLLDGWGMACADDESKVQHQVHRCALAAAVIQACERTDTAATVWLLTRNAGVAMGGGLASDASVADAALWGYGRTLANEASNYRVRLVDLPADEPAVAALVRELLHPDAEDEVLIDAEGQRQAPRLRVVERPVPAAQESVQKPACRLGFDFPGQLRNLRWESYEAAEPADDQIEVRIQATGLNFRDVMYALGMLSDEAIENGFAGPTLGLEFSGVVTRVGLAVSGYKAGDNVVGFGPASFGDRVLTRASAISHIPAGFSFEAAATIPSTFFTVYYALRHLAHLEEGERILIHGGAGGVGLAAIQYAQSVGAEIYATAGTEEKRDFLCMMGVTHVYDSRSLSYGDEILADTGGIGVDVVLNSLAGEAINRNLQVLRPFGRFLELGKRDFYENTRIGLRPFRNNISYFGIDADQLMSERPDLTRRLFGEMMQLFADGALHPLPYSVFDANDVVNAFRYMQQARQIGKIVVTYRNGIHQLRQPSQAAAPVLNLPAQATYLVTGGLGGFGLRTAQWLAAKGARNLVLISRSGPAADSAREAVTALTASGVRVHAAACDVTDRKALEQLLDHIARDMPPLRGIVHAAVVIDDGLARSARADQIERTMAAKVLGAYHLHALTQKLPLDFCVYYSSATTLFGNPGQSNYVAANHWLEALAVQRRAQGLPATCVRWGAIDDVGFLARNEKIKDALQGRMGGSAMESSLALDALETMLLTNASGLGVLELDWNALNRFLPSAGAPKFSGLARGDSAADDDRGDDVAHMLATLDEAALHAAFTGMLKTEIGQILRITADKIDPERSIYDMGLDSLMGVELIVALENRFGVRLPVMALSISPTVEKLATRLIQLLRGDDAAPAVDQVTSLVEKLASDHAVDVSADTLKEIVEEIKSDDANPPRRMIT